MTAVAQRSGGEDFAARINRASRELGTAAMHVARATRDQSLRILAAAQEGDASAVASRFEQLKNSSFVQGVASSLTVAKEKVEAVWAQVKEFASTLGPIVVGLTMVAGAVLLMAEIGAVLTVLLALAGLMIAYNGVSKLF